jgi:hypothetical protein
MLAASGLGTQTGAIGASGAATWIAGRQRRATAADALRRANSRVLFFSERWASTTARH